MADQRTRGSVAPASPARTAERQAETAAPASHPAAVLARAGRGRAALSPADVQQLQRTLGNRAVGRILGRTPPPVRLRTGGSGAGALQANRYNHANLAKSFAILTDSPGKITVEGQLVRGVGDIAEITGALTYKGVRLRKDAVSNAMFSSFSQADTLSIGTLAANPMGHRIGDLLMHQLGQLAKDSGIGYVIAGDVTGARGPYYEPLGFRDLLNAPTWADLTAEKDAIAARIRNEPDMDAKTLTALMTRKDRIAELMAQNVIFIETDTLIAATAAKLHGRWNAA